MQNGSDLIRQGLDNPPDPIDEQSPDDVVTPVGKDAVDSMVKAMALFERHKKAAIVAIEREEYDHAAELVAELRAMSSEFRKAIGLRIL
ncbi:hypothetical protein [Pararhizobium sp. DWP3-4]|uniref:hypothetical protein n=1 Tax=Pararhizobium sp. DWP3-4 TaxID=2804565 RepID=UPI003CF57761